LRALRVCEECAPEEQATGGLAGPDGALGDVDEQVGLSDVLELPLREKVSEGRRSVRKPLLFPVNIKGVKEAEGVRRGRAFVRDVGINVLANLLAASLIYLGGALVGLFPRDPKAIVSAVALLLLGVSLSPFLASSFLRNELREISFGVGAMLFGASMLIASFSGLDLGALTGSTLSGRIGIALIIVWGAWAARRDFRRYRRRIADDRQIKGLHWYEPR
jgi:hypothetical protein